jgi:hypothetical protein
MAEIIFEGYFALLLEWLFVCAVGAAIVAVIDGVPMYRLSPQPP